MSGTLTDDFGLGHPDAPVRALLRCLPEAGVLVVDRDLRVVVCDGEPLRAAGWAPAELEGKLLADVLPADRWAEVEPHYRAALAGLAQGFTIPHPSGHTYRAVAAPLQTPGETTSAGVLVMVVDTSDDVAVDRRLREAQALLGAAFDSAPTAIVVFDAGDENFGSVLRANDATARLFGFDADSTDSRRLHDVFPPEVASDHEFRLRALARTHVELGALTEPLVDVRGRRLWARMHLSFVRDDAGHATVGIMHIEDITQERLHEDALRVSEERFGLVFDHAPVAMGVIDLQPGREGFLIEVNGAYAELVGRTQAELVGMHLRDFVHPDDDEPAAVSLQDLATGTVDDFISQKRFVRPDGTVRTVRVRAASVADADGNPRYGIGVLIDVTERVQAEEARESILESVLEGIVAVDAEWRITVFNRSAEEMFGHARADVLGRSLEVLIAPDQLAAHVAAAARSDDAPGALVIDRREVVAVHADGSPIPVEISVHRTARGSAEYTAFVRDLTDQRRAERRSRGAEDLFRSMFEHSAVPMAVLTLDGRVVEANPQMCRFLGRTPEEMLTVTAEDVMHPEDAVPLPDTLAALSGDISPARARRFVRADGQVVWGHVQSTLLRDEHGRPRGVQAQVIDITAQRQTTARLGAVLESLAEGVFVIDDDGHVEKVNAAAERMLGYTEARLAGRSLHEVIHAHTGAAEDCPILRVAGTGETVRVEDDSFARADGTLLPVTYSAAPLGIGDDRGVVVVFSDISERKAREQGLRRRLAALDRLEQTRQALVEDRLVLYSQPILDVEAGEVVQEELLLRMLDADGSVVPPGEFLPVAEEYGLIADIDRWVIGHAAAFAAQGRHVEVNVSGRTLGHPNLTQWVEEALAASGADPRLMTFEITETALTNDLEQACRFAEHVSALGCGFALDDFGTGYGSFTLLKRLPISYLKIDMDFVRNLVNEDADRHVVQAVVSLARGLGMRTIAEGVEDQETLDVLGAMGVDYAQGYLIGRPAPA